ncbi:MAG: hypothetical protein ACE141_08655 [Bryobacteraceae bacterium]
MMKIAVAFLTVALSMASAKSYTVNVFQPAVLAGAELKAGEYKLEILGDKISMKSGKLKVEAPVTVENMPAENRSTTMRIDTDGGKPSIREIRLGGTNLKLVVN